MSWGKQFSDCQSGSGLKALSQVHDCEDLWVPINAAVRSLLKLPVPASLWVMGVHPPETTPGLNKPELNEHYEVENEQNLY